MTATVDEDVPHNAVATLATKTVLVVAFLGRGFVPFHCQVVMGYLELLVGRFGVQFKRLA